MKLKSIIITIILLLGINIHSVLADDIEQADALKESLFRLKFRKSLGVGDTLADIRREKKTLARVYTLIGQKSGEEKQA